MRGALFEVWPNGCYAGDIEVLTHATAAPRLYGGRVSVQKPQYRGTIETSGENFVVDDLYAAIRRIARAVEVVPAE